ncbi:MAG: NtaA/DmoA family FMN-dependent monooxygenase [Dehalococcoidia bacterium]|nr:NtaA/DmoA family FMN-dependent monooxygenase [Dehalococcoidia bacterium]
MLRLVAMSQCTPTSQPIGQWKNPLDEMSSGYVRLKTWCEIAQTLERGCIDAFFLADIHGIYDGYGNSRDAAIRYAVQTPGVDPMMLVSAMANVTENIGFICTYSTTFHPPYECARAFSTLDHFTKGRIGWNVVTSYIKNAESNGLGEFLSHDRRYDRAEEYMEVVYKLWEGSWESDAVVRDVLQDTHTDPSKVHAIDHKGDFFSVQGPHMCEPSPQRTPMLFQAGASPRGSAFGAKHAEAVFVVYDEDSSNTAKNIERFRQLVQEQGRDPASVKVMMAFTAIAGETEREAKLKQESFQQYSSTEGQLALFGGWTGIDLKGIDLDEPIQNTNLEGMQAIALKWKGRTIRDFLSQRPPAYVGSVSKVVDRMEELYGCGVDGFVMHPMIQPQSHEELVDLIVPELQQRGLFRKTYESTTLRGNFSDTGNSLPHTDHPASSFRRYG